MAENENKNNLPVKILTPADFYLILIGKFQRLAKYWGFDIFTEGYKLNIKILFALFLAFWIYVAFAYETLMGISQRNLDRLLQGALFVGCITQV